MNFKIVDGEDYYHRFDDFVEEYNKGTLQKHIKELLGLGDSKYRHYLKKAHKEGLVEPRKQKMIRNAKYYTRKKNGSYVISHRDKNTGKMRFYGTFHSKGEVENRVKELIQCDWEE